MSLYATSPGEPNTGCGYKRRRPEVMVLYDVVRDNAETLHGAIDDGTPKVPPERFAADMRAGLDEFAKRTPGAKIGAIGSCFGGE
ncbi:MAG TPA: hypothetical protein VE093_32090 [Polyangiaceae bacterium]|nr:hypothetical protein [Polyangiaceae bacterium]